MHFQLKLWTILETWNNEIVNKLCFKCDKLAFLPSGVQSYAKIGSEDAIVLRVNAEVDNAHALQLDVNVTQMSVEIAGLGNVKYITLIFCELDFTLSRFPPPPSSSSSSSSSYIS